MKTHYLKHVDSPEDLKKIKPEHLPKVAKELRDFIISIVADKEGHLGASLGVIELTLALHYVYNTPKDVLIWDVGHQAYGHKIITGRREQFYTNRQWMGISGFPKISESPYDHFGVGHSSTSISALLGIALADNLKGNLNKHIAVIGDASIASGMAFEALNHLGETQTNCTIILNDNNIGIDQSIGGLKKHLNNLDFNQTNKPNFFQQLGLTYFGPYDGHCIKTLLTTFTQVECFTGPKIVHIKTVKGKGLNKAEENQVIYHAPGKFDKKTGERISIKPLSYNTKYQDVFGHTLVELAHFNSKIVGITPAMPSGSSLKYLMEAYPDRAFDVGIAEQHAVTLASGLAKEGMLPYCTIYSTFLQRAYDQIIHDVALQNLPVIFCVDRAGLVGHDGPTHHGVFDISFLRLIPNMVILAPIDAIELRLMLYSVQFNLDHPLAIRYPRGECNIHNWHVPFKKIDYLKAIKLRDGQKKAILSVGHIGQFVAKAIEHKHLNHIAHYHMRSIKPLDENCLNEVFKNFDIIYTFEESIKIGGFGQAVLNFKNINNYDTSIEIIGIEDEFIPHGSMEDLYDYTNLTVNKIQKRLINFKTKE